MIFSVVNMGERQVTTERQTVAGRIRALLAHLPPERLMHPIAA